MWVWVLWVWGRRGKGRRRKLRIFMARGEGGWLLNVVEWKWFVGGFQGLGSRNSNADPLTIFLSPRTEKGQYVFKRMFLPRGSRPPFSIPATQNQSD